MGNAKMALHYSENRKCYPRGRSMKQQSFWAASCASKSGRQPQSLHICE